MWYNVFLFLTVCSITYLLKKILSNEPNYVKFQFNFIAFYFITIFTSTVFLPLFILRPKNVRNTVFAAHIIKHFTQFYDIKWELRNGEILAEDRGAVIVANHQSSFDLLGMFNIWELVYKMTAIAKKELFYVWPFGLSAYLSGIVFIDRRNSKEAIKQLQVTSKIMVEKNVKIWIFPEGTRNKDYRKLLPFKKGAFVTAVSAQVPIIPVLFSPYYFINPKEYIFNNGHVIIKCLEPVSTKGLTMEDVPDLTNRIYEQMQTAYRELSQEVFDALPSDYLLNNKIIVH